MKNIVFYDAVYSIFLIYRHISMQPFKFMEPPKDFTI